MIQMLKKIKLKDQDNHQYKALEVRQRRPSSR